MVANEEIALWSAAAAEIARRAGASVGRWKAHASATHRCVTPCVHRDQSPVSEVAGSRARPRKPRDTMPLNPSTRPVGRIIGCGRNLGRCRTAFAPGQFARPVCSACVCRAPSSARLSTPSSAPSPEQSPSPPRHPPFCVDHFRPRTSLGWCASASRVLPLLELYCLRFRSQLICSAGSVCRRLWLCLGLPSAQIVWRTFLVPLKLRNTLAVESRNQISQAGFVGGSAGSVPSPMANRLCHPRAALSWSECWPFWGNRSAPKRGASAVATAKKQRWELTEALVELN
jgi:hypothetical protein